MTSASPRDGHCERLLERLSRYMDGDLPDADRRRIEEHLRGCPECEEVLHSLEHTVDLCREEGRPDLPPDLRARALDRVHQLLMAAPAPARRRKAR
ncbi:MAG: hypothetical protein H6Q10_200 [Acidobacteria bacterium]|nr:hypothetical protein [Acidobacteriota bacterium]